MKQAMAAEAAAAEKPTHLRKVGFRCLCETCGWGLDEYREVFYSGKPEQLRFDVQGTDEDGRVHTIAAATWEQAKDSPELLCPEPMHEAFQFAYSRDFR